MTLRILGVLDFVSHLELKNPVTEVTVGVFLSSPEDGNRSTS
jgi:hypothetical protein